MFPTQQKRKLFYLFLFLSLGALLLPCFALHPQVTGVVFGWRIFFGYCLFAPVFLVLCFCQKEHYRRPILAKLVVWGLLLLVLIVFSAAPASFYRMTVGDTRELVTIYPSYWLSLLFLTFPLASFPLCVRK